MLSTTGVETPVELGAQAGYAVETATRPAQLRWSGAGGGEHSRTFSWPAVSRSR